MSATRCSSSSRVGTAKGCPAGSAASDIALPVRLFHLADIVEVFHRRGGVDAAIEVARARRGTHFDPALVDVFCAAAGDVLGDRPTSPTARR